MDFTKLRNYHSLEKTHLKIIISATTSWNIYNSRLGLARALKKQGHDVVLLAPEDEYSCLLQEEGFRWQHFPLNPRGKNIFQEISAILYQTNFYIRERPDLVNHFTPKGVIYGSIAAKLSKMNNIFNTITGLGYVFSDESRKRLQKFLLFLYRIALAKTTVLFQNPDDMNYFFKNGIVTPQQSSLIFGSGVDMDSFKFLPQSDEKPVVLLSSRFVEEKGIQYFVEAARLLKKREIEVRMVLVGKPEENQSTAIQTRELSQWVSEGIVEWWGWHDDMKKIYPLANIVCLPTFYKEGIPKTLIEGAACGRPLIATDVPGCREIVKDGENGFLIPKKDAESLSDAIVKLAEDAELRDRMGKRSREIAMANFSLEKVVSDYFEIYQI